MPMEDSNNYTTLGNWILIILLLLLSIIAIFVIWKITKRIKKFKMLKRIRMKQANVRENLIKINKLLKQS